MVSSGPPGKRRPVHARHGLGRETKTRLVELGRQLPAPSGEMAKIMAADRAAWLKRRLAVGLVVVVVVAVVVGATVQWFRPISQPTLQGLTTGFRVPGSAPKLPWPSTGEAALSVQGLGSLGQDRDTRPVPIGVLSGVLTAYVILKDHPLSTGGDTGPTIAVTPQTLATYQAGSAAGEPEVPISSGESLTELDALEGLLIDSANDMATLLADWDAGSTTGFVTKMDLRALSLGLRHTHITEPSGANAMLSTPSDLIRLAEVAMRIPVFNQIVSLGEVNLPESGLQYNPNFVLGENGVIGIEVGSDTTANGCYLFAAQKVIGGQTVTLYGAVLGQSGPNGPDTAAVDAGDALMKVALSNLTNVPVLRAGRVVGRLFAPWGASTRVTVSQAVTVPAWPGLSISVTARRATLTAPVAAGTRVGSLQIHDGPRVIEVPLHNTAPLQGPSWLWRLTR
jgi:serine-type D-Ala-D-Ala carboxypeptidase (penicillin-binding protein 5/6)